MWGWLPSWRLPDREDGELRILTVLSLSAAFDADNEKWMRFRPRLVRARNTQRMYSKGAFCVCFSAIGREKARTYVEGRWFFAYLYCIHTAHWIFCVLCIVKLGRWVLDICKGYRPNWLLYIYWRLIDLDNLDRSNPRHPDAWPVKCTLLQTRWYAVQGRVAVMD